MVTPQQIETNLTVSTNITKDELKQMIVEAYFDIEKKKEESKKQIEDQEQNNWHNYIGYKDNNKILCRIMNRISVFLKIMLKPKKYIRENVAISFLIEISLQGIIKLLEYTFLLAPIIFYILNYKSYSTEYKVSFIPVILIFIMISRILRMAYYEVEKIKDKIYMVSVFMGITSFIMLIVTIITVIKGML